MNKEVKLENWMQRQDGVLVAYSGGVDSAYLAYIGTRVLGRRCVAVTGVSPSVGDHQLEVAKKVAFRSGFNHRLVETFEIDSAAYVQNTGDRCFHCKSELYKRLLEIGDKDYKGFRLVDGTNADDLSDFRPGRKAASDLGVVSPLAEFGFTKQEIRERSRLAGLETWDKPASPCLASRIADGVPVTIVGLGTVEKGEAILRRYGFDEFRFRILGEVARVEISPREMSAADFDSRLGKASEELESLGVGKIFLNLDGFKSGSLNDPESKVRERMLVG
ncbi:MAG: ATP-dependent sacrificial sulfur transferase LarE [Pyrinomonadaceae bacterium]|nr:ATP-dependent sacrificial sulfur transferase LarE [Pyrinomonadaceae bacterium]